MSKHHTVLAWRLLDGAWLADGKNMVDVPLDRIGMQEPLVVYTERVPVASLRGLMTLDEPSVFWRPPDGLCVLGFGEAAVVHGCDAEEIRERSGQLWKRVQPASGSEGFVPVPRLFGGLAFSKSDCLAAPWQDLGKARFFLPRIQYVCDSARERAWIQAYATAEEAAWVSLQVSALQDRLSGAAGLRPSETGPSAKGSFVAGLDDTEIDEWRCRVEAIQRLIHQGTAQKIVAARRIITPLHGNAPELVALDRLVRHDPGSTTFLLRAGPAVYVGASPETLVDKCGPALRTDALAGSAPLRADVSQALLHNDKERREHEFVVNTITDDLRAGCQRVDVPPLPRVRRLRHIQHLHTPIRAVEATTSHVLDWVSRLHPTPAVSGLPKKLALDFIQSREPHSRGWYTGPVGWFSASGDGHFVVSLRSALLHHDCAYVYAGAGIVAGSHWEQEWQETALKMRTMLEALNGRGDGDASHLRLSTSGRIHSGLDGVGGR